MPHVLIARPARQWKRGAVTVALVIGQVLLGLLVLALRTVRVALTLAVTAFGRLEQQLAARTGRPALSDTGIAALATAFAHEFVTAYRASAR